MKLRLPYEFELSRVYREGDELGFDPKFKEMLETKEEWEALSGSEQGRKWVLRRGMTHESTACVYMLTFNILRGHGTGIAPGLEWVHGQCFEVLG